MQAYLILEDGTRFEGTAIGGRREVISEIVFNTSMTGYLEILTDPSYAGQSVVMTYPLIGNYGICLDDAESSRPWVEGYIVRELSRMPSNFRAEKGIEEYLAEHDIPGVAGIDTRALTRILREKGTMNGLITTKDYRGSELEEKLAEIRAYRVRGVVKKVSRNEPEFFKAADHLKGDAHDEAETVNGRGKMPPGLRVAWAKDGEYESAGILAGTDSIKKHFSVALYDFGVKQNIVRSLQKRGCDVTVYPAQTPAETVLSAGHDGIMLSNGPGDPEEVTDIIAEVKKIYESGVPTFAICLGHQLMALANGASTHKLKYGHRGANHPVRDMSTGHVYISTQNHGYVVDETTLDPKKASPLFENVNDGTNEGVSYRDKPVFTVQFHPEACGGPLDTGFLFDRFIQMMEDANA